MPVGSLAMAQPGITQAVATAPGCLPEKTGAVGLTHLQSALDVAHSSCETRQICSAFLLKPFMVKWQAAAVAQLTAAVSILAMPDSN